MDVFTEARYNNEDFILIDFQLLDKDIYESSEVLVLRRVHLEQLGDVEEHG